MTYLKGQLYDARHGFGPVHDEHPSMHGKQMNEST
jgi:hypothetical protein